MPLTKTGKRDFHAWADKGTGTASDPLAWKAAQKKSAGKLTPKDVKFGTAKNYAQLVRDEMGVAEAGPGDINRLEHRGAEYNVYFNQRKGMYTARGTGQMSGQIQPEWFHTLADAQDHAEMEIGGYDEHDGVSEGSLGSSPDRLDARTGINISHKTPRLGQTNLGNIPGGNQPGSSRDTTAYMNAQRAERSAKLKSAIKGQLGKHHKPNLPEQDVAEGKPQKKADRYHIY
jgi:hypothetical protein